MSQPSTPLPVDRRNVLFGLLAFQNGRIDRDGLVTAFNRWCRDKRRLIGDILIELHALDAAERDDLDRLVEEQIGKQKGERPSSQALGSAIAGFAAGLRSIADPDLQKALAWLAPEDTAPPRGGTIAPLSTGLTSLNFGDETPPGSFSAPPTEPPAPSLGTAARFRILRPHARGGLGKVSVALDLELNREVALKEMKGHFAEDPAIRNRFVLEAEVTGALEHPGIVPVYGLGTYPDGRPFYAMRFIRGESLQEAIEGFHGADRGKKVELSGRNPAFRKLLQRVVHVCDAIQYAHDRGILHRDLKPANIMLGKYGETLVVDWGLAKRLADRHPAENGGTMLAIPLRGESSHTLAGLPVGTPQFMSPEQAAGKLEAVGPPSDIYSLGATLYHLIAGEPPVNGANIPQILRCVLEGDFPSARARNPRAPAALDAICRKAMALDPARRYASARAMAEDIEAWLADEPVAAAPDTLIQRLFRMARKHRGVFRAVALATVLIAVVSVAAAFLINEQRRQTAKLAQEKGALADRNADLLESERKARDQAEKLAKDKSELAADKTNLAVQLQALVDAKDLLVKEKSDLATKNGALALEQSRLAGEMSELATKNGKLAKEAQEQLQIATAQRLAAQSRTVRGDFPQRSALLAIASANATLSAGLSIVSQAHEELYESQRVLGGTPLVAAQAEPALIAYSADHQRIAVGGREGEVRLVSVAADGTVQAARLPPAHRVPITAMSFSADGARLSTGDQAGNVRLWDVGGGPDQSGVELNGHRAQIVQLAFAADGRCLAARDLTGQVRLWNLAAADAAPSAIALHQPDAPIVEMVVSTDGRRVATGDRNGEVRLRDLGAEDVTAGGLVLRGHRKRITRIAISRDGRRLVSGDERGDLRMWDLAKPNVADNPIILDDHDKWIDQIEFTPDGKRMVTRSDGKVRIWIITPLASGEIAVGGFMLKGYDEPIRECAVSPDGRWLLTGGALFGEVRKWDLTSKGPAPAAAVWKGRGAEIVQMAVSHDSRRVATLDRLGAARLWDLASSDPNAASDPLRGHDAPVERLSFTPDGRWLMTADRSAEVRRWDLAAADINDRSVLLRRANAPDAEIVFSHNGNRMATLDASGEFRVWDMTAADVARSAVLLNRQKKVDARPVALTPDGRKLVSWDGKAELRLWDVASPEKPGVEVRWEGHEVPVQEVRFGPRGRRMVTLDANGVIRVWDLADPDFPKNSILLGEREQVIQQFEFSHDGRRLATRDQGGRVRLWDLAAANATATAIVLDGPPEGVTQILFSIDGARLVGAAPNGQIRLWNPEAASEPGVPFKLKGQESRIVQIGFSPKGRRLLTLDENGELRLWDLNDEGGRHVPFPLQGERASDVKFAFTADSSRLAAKIGKSDFQLWDLSSPDVGVNALPLGDTDAEIVQFSFSPDGQVLVTADDKGGLRLWDLNIPRLLARLRESAGRDLSATEQRMFRLPTAEAR